MEGKAIPSSTPQSCLRIANQWWSLICPLWKNCCLDIQCRSPYSAIIGINSLRYYWRSHFGYLSVERVDSFILFRLAIRFQHSSHSKLTIFAPLNARRRNWWLLAWTFPELWSGISWWWRGIYFWPCFQSLPLSWLVRSWPTLFPTNQRAGRAECPLTSSISPYWQLRRGGWSNTTDIYVSSYKIVFPTEQIIRRKYHSIWQRICSLYLNEWLLIDLLQKFDFFAFPLFRLIFRCLL